VSLHTPWLNDQAADSVYILKGQSEGSYGDIHAGVSFAKMYAFSKLIELLLLSS